MGVQVRSDLGAFTPTDHKQRDRQLDSQRWQRQQKIFTILLASPVMFEYQSYF